MVFSDFRARHDISGDTNASILVEQNANEMDTPYDPLDARPPVISVVPYGNAASGIGSSHGFPDDDMRDMLIEQATMYREKEIEAAHSPSPSLSTSDDDPVHTPRFVVFRLPCFGPEPCEKQKECSFSPSVQYISTSDPHTLASGVPWRISLPEGVLACPSCLICCTVLSACLTPIDLLYQLLEQSWCTTTLEPSFRPPFPLSRVQVEDVRIAYERATTSDLDTQPVTRCESLLDGQRSSLIPLSVHNTATGIALRAKPGSVASSAHESIEIGRSAKPKLSSTGSLATSDSLASFATAKSTQDEPASKSLNGNNPVNLLETVRENDRPAPGLSAPLMKLHFEYYTSLHQQKIIQPFDKELNWSGKGQHVTFTDNDTIPLSSISHLGASMSATVDKVICRRIALARKTMRCSRGLKMVDALREVYHLQNLRHFHIIQLVGTYLQGRNFSILMYPAADMHLGRFMEDTLDMGMRGLYLRRDFLLSALGCLTSAVAFIHQHTTKHMDIKPQNILIRDVHPESDHSDWRVYIADFGLSRSFAAQDHSQTDGPTSRTPKYCAPEVYNSEERGRSADIFSLGCVFMEISCVIAGIHPQDFAIVRRGPGIDESFHANIDRVVVWAHDFLYAGLCSWLSYLRYGDLYSKALVEVLINMVRRDPGERPTATEVYNKIVKFTRYIIPVYSCCSLPPEPYEYWDSS